MISFNSKDRVIGFATIVKTLVLVLESSARSDTDSDSDSDVSVKRPPKKLDDKAGVKSKSR